MNDAGELWLDRTRVGDARMMSPSVHTLPSGCTVRWPCQLVLHKAIAEDSPVQLMAGPAEITLRAPEPAGDLQLPLASPILALQQVLAPGEKTHVQFEHYLPTGLVAALDRLIDGRQVRIAISFDAHWFIEGTLFYPGFRCRIEREFRREDWIQIARGAGLHDRVVIELPLPGDNDLMEGLQAAARMLSQAMGARLRSDHRQALLLCRDALEALEGFGLKPPSSGRIADLLRRQPEVLTKSERLELLHVTIKRYVHLSGHSGDFSGPLAQRESLMAVAIVASLLQMAPLRSDYAGAPDER